MLACGARTRLPSTSYCDARSLGHCLADRAPIRDAEGRGMISEPSASAPVASRGRPSSGVIRKANSVGSRTMGRTRWRMLASLSAGTTPRRWERRCANPTMSRSTPRANSAAAASAVPSSGARPFASRPTARTSRPGSVLAMACARWVRGPISTKVRTPSWSARRSGVLKSIGLVICQVSSSPTRAAPIAPDSVPALK